MGVDEQTEKCVVILREGLPPGLMANTAVILGLSLGAKRPDLIGEATPDRQGRPHAGVIRFPVPVLRCDAQKMNRLCAKLAEPEYSGLTVVDFTTLAQGCRTYGEYIEKMAATDGGALETIGAALCGDRKTVNRLTGNLPLAR